VHQAPDARKGKRLVRFQGDPVGHFALSSPLPFVKAVCKDQTALRPEGLPEERFGRHRLRPGMDEESEVAPVIGPFRPQAPAAYRDDIGVRT
jgi:hypothetical protein